jgi:hypothetical protein
MSNTFRKDKNNKIFKEGLKKKSIEAHYRCQCYHCVGADKNDLIDKIAEKELKTEIEYLDFDILAQDEILEQIFRK